MLFFRGLASIHTLVNIMATVIKGGGGFGVVKTLQQQTQHYKSDI